MLRLSLISFACAAALMVGYSPNANASLRDSFDYYKRNPSGSYSNDQMKGWVGPSFHARNDMVNPRLISAQVPSWNAGCGGIDFFSGSFSIISKDELVQMARGIAQGAPGYFFNLAMGAVCPSCQEQMAELQKKLEEFNKFAQDSCQRTWDLVEEKTGWQESSKGTMAVLGTEKDTLSGLIPDFGAFLSDKSTKEGATDNQIEVAVGNPLVEKAKDAFTANGVQEFLSDLTVPELYASVFGTLIAYPVDQGTPQQNVGFKREDHSIEFNRILFNTNIEQISILRCTDPIGDPKCLIMSPQSLTFEGLVQKNHRLLGSETDSGSGLGILFKIRNSQPLTEEQEQFRLNTRFAYEETVKRFKDHPNLLPTVSMHMAHLIAKEQLTQFYQGLRQPLLKLTTEGNDLTLAQREAIRKDIENADARFKAAIDDIDHAITVINNSMALTASLTQILYR